MSRVEAEPDVSWYVFQKEYDFAEETHYWVLDCHDTDINDWMKDNEGYCISSVGYGTLWRISDRRFVEFLLRFPSPEFPTLPFQVAPRNL